MSGWFDAIHDILSVQPNIDLKLFHTRAPHNSSQKPRIEVQSLTTGLEKLEEKLTGKAQLTRVSVLAVRIHHPPIPACCNILRCTDGACARRNLALLGRGVCYPEGER